jgi:hypothetical protein
MAGADPQPRIRLTLDPGSESGMTGRGVYRLIAGDLFHRVLVALLAPFVQEPS